MSSPMAAEPEQLEIDEPKGEEKISAEQIMKLLTTKFGREEFAVLFDIGDAVGTKYRRRADAVVTSFWQSGGHLIQGFEIKVSRSDWLRELKQVEKADPFLALVDRWWLIAGQDVAKDSEIPACWGWMSPGKHGLRVQRPAKALAGAGGAIDRLFGLELLKKASRSQLETPEVRAAIAAAGEAREKTIRLHVESEISRRSRELDHLRGRVEQFEKASGMRLEDWSLGNVGELAKAIAQLRLEGYGSASARLEEHERTLSDLIGKIRGARVALEKLDGRGEVSPP